MWTWKRELVAKLIAEGDKSVAQIAAQCQISERGIYRWKAAPEFQARVREHVDNYRRKVLSAGYCRKENRILLHQKLIEKCLRIIEERAAHPGMENVPGGKTGLIMLRARNLGGGRMISEFATDAITESIIRANLHAIAQEVGGWGDRREAGDSGNNGAPTIVFRITPEQMAVAGDPIVDFEALLTD
jgi:hypothetical protein